MRRSLVLVVCLVVILGGCSALPGASDSDAQETTADEATVRSEANGGTDSDATESDADLPPGLSTDGVTDAGHSRRTRGVAFGPVVHLRPPSDRHRERRHRDRPLEPARAGRSRQTGIQPHADRRGRQRLRAESCDSQVYTDGSVTFWKADALRDGFRREPGQGFTANTFSSEQLLADVLNASETSVTELQSDGETWYHVRAENGSETLTYQPPNGTVVVEVNNVTATAVVAPSGFVRNVTYDVRLCAGERLGPLDDDRPLHAVGETTVEFPAWVEDARTVTDETSEG